MTTPVILTIGHSTRTLGDLVGILQAYGVRLVVDVRTIPRSRHNPQFNKENLSAGLKESDMDYVWLKELGGLRHPKPDSLNKGWRNESFRGFADYMQTSDFEAGINELIKLAEKDGPVAIMCAEAVPWRCHRSLIADALLVRGFSVRHLMTPKTWLEHSMTKWAHVDGKQITYLRFRRKFSEIDVRPEAENHDRARLLSTLLEKSRACLTSCLGSLVLYQFLAGS